MKERLLQVDVDGINWAEHFNHSICNWLEKTKRVANIDAIESWSIDLEREFKKDFDTFIDNKDFSYMFLYQDENPYLYPTDLIGHICDRYMKHNTELALKYRSKIEKSFF